MAMEPVELIGTQVGSWQLLKFLGAGGMGRVFLAKHAMMGDLWAVKVLSDELNQRPEVVARFVNEARAAAKVRHKNLIRVYHIDQIRDSSRDNGPWYMVLDYLEGSTLGQLIGECGGPLPLELMVRILCQIASALGELHKHDVVHRDVKADNIMLVVRGADRHFPILLDLGVAFLGEAVSGSATTLRGTIVGTPSSMAPEQLLGHSVGPSSDLYALGVLAYEMSTGGWLPYQRAGESRDAYMQLPPAELYRRQSAEALEDPRRWNPGMTDAWAKLMFRLLEVEPARRIANARDAVIAIAEAAPGDGAGRDGLAIVREYASELFAADQAPEGDAKLRASPIIASAGNEARYAVGRKLGAGGMAEVFAGTQIGEQGFERAVAIKRILPELSAQPGFEAMFIAEARIACRLAHPNVVSVIDFRKDDQNRLFLVMEFVEGNDLAGLLEAGSLPASTIIFIVVEILRGLGYAHNRVDPVSGTRGVVHRDISPQNVLLSNEGEVKLSDFGLARVRDHAGRAASSTIRGKPSYMSPEQVRGELLDNRSDLWGVGVILWEMLAAQPLFVGSVSEVMGHVLYKDIASPTVLRPEAPADLAAVAMRLVRREPRARYATAEDVIADLLRCRDASLNGRDELAAQLAKRFARQGVDDRRGQATAVLATRGWRDPYAASHPSTLGSAASESTSKLPPGPTPVPAKQPRRLRGAIVTVPALVLCGVAGVLLTQPKAPAASGPVADKSMEGSEGSSSGRVDAGAERVVQVAVDAGAIALPADAMAVIDMPVVPPPAKPDDTPSHAPPDNPPVKPPVPPPPPPPPLIHRQPGELAILVKPWANITIDNKPYGTTPFRQHMPSGKHVIRLVNDELSQNETITIAVEPNRTATVERKWQ